MKTPRPPGLKELSEHAGVSMKTVSNFINGSHVFPLSSETAERIRTAMVALNYRVNEAGSQMRRKEPSKRVAVFLLGAHPELQPERVYGVPRLRDLLIALAEAVRRDLDLDLTVRHVPDPGDEAAWRQAVLHAEILFVWEQVDPRLRALAGLRNLPLIQVADSGPGVIDHGQDGVFWDVAAEVRLAVGHLRRRGLERLVYLSTWNVAANRGVVWNHIGERSLDVFRNVCAELGVESRVVVEAMPGPDGLAEEAELGHGRRAVADHPELFAWAQGVVAGNDHIAMGACLGLQAAGRRPGQDVLVVGSGDYPFARHFAPAITTVAGDREAWLAAVLDLARARLRCNRPAGEHRQIPARLVIRTSA